EARYRDAEKDARDGGGEPSARVRGGRRGAFRSRAGLLADVEKRGARVARGPEGAGRDDQLLGDVVRPVPARDAAFGGAASAVLQSRLHAARRERGREHVGRREVPQGDAGVVRGALRSRERGERALRRRRDAEHGHGRPPRQPALHAPRLSVRVRARVSGADPRLAARMTPMTPMTYGTGMLRAAGLALIAVLPLA